jgi:predicted amidohydrolase YtcJ
MRFSLLMLAALVFMSACSNRSVDLIVHHGKIYAVDSQFAVYDAMAIKDGKIVELGTNDDILKKYSSKEEIDLEGAAAYPGFIDGHAHFVGYGRGLFQVDLFGVPSWEEAVARVQKFAEEHPNEPWIVGRGWDQNLWAGRQFPTNELLNKAVPDRPVLLTRVDGHAAIANDRALALANIQAGQTLVGGDIMVERGKLSGVLIDNAVDLVTNVMPKPSSSDYEKWLIAAQEKCFEQGLTTITDCGLMYNDVDEIHRLQEAQQLNMRLYVMLSDDTANYSRYLQKGPFKTDRLFVKGIKVYADGALGSRGACLLKHYADRPGWLGFLLKEKSYFDSLASVLIKTDFQMCTHAIGDSANREVLNIYAKYLQGKNDKRWRIEHAQVVEPSDVKKFGDFNIIPSVQPTHATSDMYWAPDRLGMPRVQSAYAYQKLLEQNGWLNLGTDFPVEDISPFKTFYAAVVRKDAKGWPEKGFQMENAMSRENTLRGMTIWAAKANFMEKELGSLENGKWADFIVLDKDIMAVSETELLSTKVTRTFSAGKLVYNGVKNNVKVSR